jgi:hypothetical protein
MAPPPVKLPSDKAVEYVVRVYEQLDRDLQKEIALAASAGFKDTVSDLKARQARVAVLIAKARQRALPMVAALQAKGYEAGVDFSIRNLRKQMANAQINALLGPRDNAAVQVLAENAVSKFENINQLVGRRVDDALRTLALEQATQSLAAGEGRRELSDRLEEALQRAGLINSNGSYSWVTINNRNYELGNYTRLVARTTTREAATQGMKNRLLENGIDLVEIDEHSGPCSICAEYQGNIYSLTGQTEGYEIAPMPPYHVNCRCVLTPAPLL